MRKAALLLVLVLSLSSAGCRELNQFMQFYRNKTAKSAEEPKQEIVKQVESAELAKIILRPKEPAPLITKDPFFPVVTITKKEGETDAVVVDEDSPEFVLKNLSYLGMIKNGYKYFALVKNDTKKGVFGVNDQINNLTIKDIFADRIEFLKETKKGPKIFELKMEKQTNATN